MDEQATEAAAKIPVCPDCGTEVPTTDLFCENCGLRQQPAPAPAPTCVCGASLEDADEEGYCQQCGRRVRRPPSDHVEETLTAGFAGVSDRGLRHERNEDRFALLAGSRWQAAVVCDGVSSTRDAAVAAEVVTKALAEALGETLGEGLSNDPRAMLLAALEKAQQRLTGEVAGPSDATAASTTVVAAVVSGDTLTLGWAGDSRAYWIDQAGNATALTEDHSWLRQALRTGELTAEEAQASPHAHAILRWLGPDSGSVNDPQTGVEVIQRKITAPGDLLLCSDGLWNYAPDDESMTALLAEVRGSGNRENLEVLRDLVKFALSQGGQDNITAVLLRCAPSTAEVVRTEPGPMDMRTGEEKG